MNIFSARKKAASIFYSRPTFPMFSRMELGILTSTAFAYERYRARRSTTPVVTLKMVRHVRQSYISFALITVAHHVSMREEMFWNCTSFNKFLQLTLTRMSPHTTSNITPKHATCRCQTSYHSSGPVDYSRILDIQQGPSVPCHCRYAGFHRSIDLLGKSLHTYQTSAFLRNR
jgi:hypothetical protein